jgi:hypothetical protein
MALVVAALAPLVAATAAPPPRFPVVWHVGSGYDAVNGSIPAPGWPASLAKGWQCDHPGAFFPSVNVTAQFGVGNCTTIQCGPACTNPPNCANWHMGLFPEIKNFIPINGGVPQAANLSAHLETLRETVVDSTKFTTIVKCAFWKLPRRAISGPWDFSNTEALLKYTAGKGYNRNNTLFGFELGKTSIATKQPPTETALVTLVSRSTTMKQDDDAAAFGQMTHKFVASSWGAACSCDASNRSSCQPSPGIEPMSILYEMTSADAVDCLLYGSAHKSCAWPWSNMDTGLGTHAQPQGRRIVRITGTDQLRQRKVYGKTDLPPLWIDEAVATLRTQSATFFERYYYAGGNLTELVQDSELFSYGGFFLEPASQPLPSVLSPEYGNKSHVRRTLQKQWLQFQQDARFPTYLAELQARGFAVANMSDPEFLSAALFPFEDDWALIGAQPPEWAGGNPNRAIWNQYLIERRSKYWQTAFVEPAQKYFPDVRGSDYGYVRSSNKGEDAYYCVPNEGGWGMLGCLSGPGAVGFGVQAPSEYLSPDLNQTRWMDEVALLKASLNLSTTKPIIGLGPEDHLSGFNRMRLAAYSVRGMVLASPTTPVKPWLGLRGYMATGHSAGNYVHIDTEILDYYQETVFHFALSGSPGFYFFNPFQCANSRPPLGVTPQRSDIESLSAALSELDRMIGWGTRAWIRDSTPPDILDDIMLTGVKLTGSCMHCGSMWRLSLPPVAAGLPVATIATVNGTFVNVTGPALREPGTAKQRTGCSLLFPQAKLVTGNASKVVGAWIWQKAEAEPPYTLCKADDSVAKITRLWNGYGNRAASATVLRSPFRAWAFAYNLTNDTLLDMYRGTNLIPTWSEKYGGPDVVEAIQRQGVSVLKWTSGPRQQWHNSSNYVQAMTPTMPGNASQMLYSGCGIDEWNSRDATVEQMAATGYHTAKKRWPGLYIAAWVTGIDTTFTSLMLDGTFDLALIEGYSYCPYCGGGLEPPWKCCASVIDDYFPRMVQARAEGWLNRSVFCFGWMLAESQWNPHGWTHAQLRADVTRLNASFPELAGLAFYGHPPGNASKGVDRSSRSADTATLELIRFASELALEFYPDRGGPARLDV